MLKYKFSPEKYKKEIEKIITQIIEREISDFAELRKILNKFPKDKQKIFSKDELIAGFKYLQDIGIIEKSQEIPEVLKMKPTRTISGVTIVTVLTKPFPCPGKCIFCPNDISMPKSYISSEPGAQRALMNRFDPYLQVYNRLKALHLIGHPTQKIELLVLGGTWSYYPKDYQIWFIKELFKALNDFNPDNLKNLDPEKEISIKWKNFTEKLRKKYSKESYNKLIAQKDYQQKLKELFDNNLQTATWEELKKEQKKNQIAYSRNVGLVLETRPDTLNKKEVLNLRKFGATKIQIGVQTLDPEINKANQRLETIEQLEKAFYLLRSAGFKIHAHIMANLYKSTPKKDFESFKKLFDLPEFRPDELKIYPTALIRHTKLFELYKQKKYQPYDQQTLIDLVKKMILYTPEYCRLTRVIRDIPSTEIVKGNKLTNLRQIAQKNIVPKDIRSREIRGKKISRSDLHLDIIKYKTSAGSEYFLQFITKKREIAGFLRLLLPKNKTNPVTSELNNSAIIREIHIYGPSIEISKRKKGASQHLGLGRELIQKAKKIAKAKGYKKLSVISAIGTKEYYRKNSFKEGELYQYIDL